MNYNSASVAPKERINIRYIPAIGDEKEEIELPFKIAVLGDFTGVSAYKNFESEPPLSINKNNFNDVMDKMQLKLNFTVKNELVLEKNRQLNINLDFRSLKDFEPDAIVTKVPQLKKLLQLRQALNILKGPLGNIPDFKKSLKDVIKSPAVLEKLLDEISLYNKEEK